MSTSVMSVVFGDSERRIEFEQVGGEEVVVRLWKADEYLEIRLTAEQVRMTADFFRLVDFTGAHRQIIDEPDHVHNFKY